MSRIRTIKPEFFTSEDIVDLSPLARIFYISLWCEADREGRLKWKPKTLKMRYLPADDCDVEKLAKELTDSGLLVIYGDNLEYAEIPSFKKHQVINNREKESDIPENSIKKSTRADASVTRESGVLGEGKGKEGKGREYINDHFDDFWKMYPEKKSKQAARNAYEKSLKKVSHEQIMSALEKYIKNKPRNINFAHASTWLNQERWEDEYKTPDESIESDLDNYDYDAHMASMGLFKGVDY